MIRFILADRQEITSFAIKHLLESLGHHNIRHAADKAEVMEQLREHEQSVVVIDYTLFDISDASNLIIISQRFPEAHWVLFSDDLTESFLREIVFQSHSVSVVFKDAPLHEIRDTLRYAADGRRYLSPRVSEILLSHQGGEEQQHSPLTATEKEIVAAIAEGKTTREIADERFLSTHTVNTHRKNIFRKLGVNTAIEAIRVARRAGWISESDYNI
ncbi:MAG: response regulator transcription factor [Prevotellaceae bacterium]|nr:response regulator transcription factor [Prevotellaceae bacterium]